MLHQLTRTQAYHLVRDLRLIKNTLVRKSDWENRVVSECIVNTDGVTSMTDYGFGVVAKIKEVAHKSMLFIHCLIHLEHSIAIKLI